MVVDSSHQSFPRPVRGQSQLDPLHIQINNLYDSQKSSSD